MPIVGISCNLKVDGRFRHHTTGEGNTVAILDAARALPASHPRPRETGWTRTPCSMRSTGSC